MTPVSPISVLARASDVRYRIVAGEAVVVRQSAAKVLGLNEVGSRLFDLLDGRTSIAELVDRMVEEYEVERELLEADALRFLAELVDAGLVELVKEPR